MIYDIYRTNTLMLHKIVITALLFISPLLLISCEQEEQNTVREEAPKSVVHEADSLPTPTVPKPSEQNATQEEAEETVQEEEQNEVHSPILVKAIGQTGSTTHAALPKNKTEKDIVYNETAARATELFSFGDEHVLISSYTPEDYKEEYAYSFWDTRTGHRIYRCTLNTEEHFGYRYPIRQEDGSYAMVPHDYTGQISTQDSSGIIPHINPFTHHIAGTAAPITQQSDYEKHYLAYANRDELGLPIGMDDPIKVAEGLKQAESSSAADGLDVHFAWPYPGEGNCLLVWEPQRLITRAQENNLICYFPHKKKIIINLENLTFAEQTYKGYKEHEPEVDEARIWYSEESLAEHPNTKWSQLLRRHLANHPGGESIHLNASEASFALYCSEDINEGGSYGRGIGIVQEKQVLYLGKNGQLLHAEDNEELRIRWAGCSLLEIMHENENEATILIGHSEDDSDLRRVHRLRVNFAQNKVNDVEQWEYTPSYLQPLWLSKLNLLLLPKNEYSYHILRLHENQGSEEIGTLYLSAGDGYAIVLPNGHYAGSPGCESLLNITEGDLTVNLKALAPWRNRPAEVLQALGGCAEDISALQATTKRWLRKQSLEADNLPEEPSLGSLPHAEAELPPLYAKEKTLRFNVKLHATQNDITRLMVRANGVLIPQPHIQEDSSCINLRKVEIIIPLVVGQNQIEVTPIDTAGFAGDTIRFRTIYKAESASELYIVTMGVSDYDDDALDLSFAAKDAQDIAGTLKEKAIGNTHTLILKDKEVISGELAEKITHFLSTANEDDRVILYVAGHGMLDEGLEYHFAPADFDTANIHSTGISMDKLAAILHGCRARARLLLLDTCHSSSLGERDLDQLAAAAVELPPGVRAVQHRGMKIKSTINTLTAKQTRRYIEDLFAGDPDYIGINIIAASAASEFALESEEWNNGVFCAAILQMLKAPGPADTNENGLLDVAELHAGVQEKVLQLTRGTQRPSAVSMDNKRMPITIAPLPKPEPPPIEESAPLPPAIDNSELIALIEQLKNTKYSNAVLKLYQRRLLAVLPLIAEGADVNTNIDTIIPKSNGTTALHNACGLGHYDIIQWLLEHGADTNIRTTSGASVETCIGNDPKGNIRKLIRSYK